MRVAVLAAGGVLLPHGISATALQARQPQFDSDQYNAGLEPRQVHPTGATNTATAAQSWDVDTDAVCRAQIATLNGVTSNPAGLAVCYNLPSMNNATGIFEAELRLYKLSDPIEDWAGVSINDMMISLAYLGAMVQADGSEGQSASAGKRAVSSQETTLTQSARRDTTSTMIQPMRVLRYLGQLNSNVRGAQMGMPQIQALLVPEIELSATNHATNKQVQIALSAEGASFLKGVFSKSGTSTFTPDSVSSATAAANSAVPFVMPGMRIQIVPVGLGVTTVWVGLFVGIVGLGTVRRIQFRNQYRRRVRREDWKGLGHAIK